MQEAGRTAIVGVDVALHLVHRLPDTGLRREMHDGLDPGQGGGEAIGIPHIAMQEFGALQLWRQPWFRAVNLSREGIEHADAAPLSQQSLDEGATDESGPKSSRSKVARFCSTCS